MSNWTWAVDLNWMCVSGFKSHGDGVGAFQSGLDKILEFEPRNLIIAADGLKNFRKVIYPDYKENRPPKEKELIQQLEECQKICRKRFFRIHCSDRHEADDILATVARKCLELRQRCVLVCYDKDMWQCLRKGRVGIYRRTFEKRWEFFSQEDAEKKWELPVEKFIEYQALMGDAADNITGAEGVGEKRARLLLQQYGDLDGIEKNLENIPGKMGENLVKFFKERDKWVRLVRLSDDVPVDLELR